MPVCALPIWHLSAFRSSGLNAIRSILYLLGLDHLRTTYLHNGRAERPTGTAGALIPKLWA